MMSKRRHYDRVSMALPFFMHIQGKTIVGKTFNISMNGVYVSVSEGDITQLGSGLKGKCQMTMKDVHITLDCQILRTYKQELAVQFTDMGPEKFNLLRALLAFGAYTKDVILAHRNSQKISENQPLIANRQDLANSIN